MDILTKILVHIAKLNPNKFDIDFSVHKVGDHYVVVLQKGEKEILVTIGQDYIGYKEKINSAISELINGDNK